MDDGQTDGLRENLAGDMDILQLELIKISEFYEDSIKYYIDSLKKSVDSAELYLNQSDLVKLHRISKKEAQSEVWFGIQLIKRCGPFFWHMNLFLNSFPRT